MKRKKLSPEMRIREKVESWYITAPLYFLVWLTHKTVENKDISSIRVHDGCIEYNPDFIDLLNDTELKDVLSFEAMRIILKHPYSRKRKNKEVMYFASNITIKEYTETKLPFITAYRYFKTHRHDKKYFEYYYNLIKEKSSGGAGNNHGKKKGAKNNKKKSQVVENKTSEAQSFRGEVKKSNNLIKKYLENWQENTLFWNQDDYHNFIINEKIEQVRDNDNWGTMPGNLREMILVSMRPKVNYRAILKNFKASVVSSNRILTRMKPSRRYGFAYMGSRYKFTSKLLFAIDVSVSMTKKDIQNGFSIVSNIFNYGIKSIDVIQFDTVVHGEKQEIKRAFKTIEIRGRGGTDFQAVFDYVEKSPYYDGLIIFTDGVAPQPVVKKRIKTVWLFNNITSFMMMGDFLKDIGVITYIHD